MTTNFDEIIEFKNTHSQKWDNMGVCGVESDDALAMWVADMDFRAPQAVLDVLQNEIERGVLGYYGQSESLLASICDWMKTQHDWEMDPGWISFSHGVVAGLGIVFEAFTAPDDGIIVFTPVYHAFARKIEAKGRRVVESQLTLENGRYEMDLDALQSRLDGSEKMVIFCSPHNPGGRLWDKTEINALADFCAKNDLILVSDEIHMDLVFPGSKHIPTAVAAPQITDRLVTVTAASKGFNIAGAETSFIVAADAKLQAKIMKAQSSFGGSPNRFGMLMMEAAFAGGREWSQEVCAYLAENFKVFKAGVDKIPGLSVMDMDSTYLAWVDFSGTGMARMEFTNRVAKDARVAVNQGPSFGSGGDDYLRFNIATRRDLVEEAVERLAHAFGDLQ